MSSRTPSSRAPSDRPRRRPVRGCAGGTDLRWGCDLAARAILVRRILDVPLDSGAWPRLAAFALPSARLPLGNAPGKCVARAGGCSFVPGDLHPLPSASSPGAPDFGTSLYRGPQYFLDDSVRQCLLLNEGMLIGWWSTISDVFAENIEIEHDSD